ncbi:MAG TPA: hypothetical protein VF754_08885, partial [Pyrinomonadaceae bacterium]
MKYSLALVLTLLTASVVVTGQDKAASNIVAQPVEVRLVADTSAPERGTPTQPASQTPPSAPIAAERRSGFDLFEA